MTTEIDTLLTQLIIVALFIAIDIVSGITQAVKNKTLSSRVAREGIYHKMGYVITIATGALCEYGSGYLELGFQLPLLVPIITLICITEIISIIENIKAITPELANSPIFDMLASNQKRRKDDEQD